MAGGESISPVIVLRDQGRAFEQAGKTKKGDKKGGQTTFFAL
mgnify:CR=1 FL=1